IIVLEEGRMIEQGSHQELLDKNGAYAGMVKAISVENQISAPGSPVEDSSLPSPTPPNLHAKRPVSGIHLPIADYPLSPQNRRLSILPRLLSFLHGSWSWVALSVLLSTLTIGSSVALIGTSAWLISTAALHPSVADLGVSVVGVRFFGISRGLFRYLERLVSHNVTFRLLARLRVWFYERLEPLAPARLMEFRSGDLLARVIGDVETLENFYVRVISPSLTAILIGIIVAVFFVAFYPPIAFVLIGFFLILGLVLPILSQVASRAPGQQLILRRAEIQSQLVDGVQGLADVLAFGRGADRLRQLRAAGETYASTQKQMAYINGIHSALGTLFTNLGVWLVLFLVIPQVTAGNIKGVMLGTFALMTLASFEAVTPLPLAAQMWNATRAAAKRLFEVVDAEPAVKETGDKRTELKSSNLKISNLSFSYPNQKAPALNEVSFTVPAGRSIAVVGPSGAGKSTLANLLLRFWEYETGEIALGGQSLKELAQDEVRKQFALVSQNNYFFNTSIRENLRLARRSISQAEMEAAARAVQLHDFILSLPRGYDTLIGEQGLRLSGGERQRLAVARALLKDAPILIFDEPTANLDPQTEKKVLDALYTAMRGKTSLLITHRLVGLENVDEILVMSHGRIVERGTHEELLAQRGLYRRLWDLQNRILSDTENLSTTPVSQF
ncbi:MAG TPA: thiol reductant ABC exporter subunit CydC, partial [Anaerolineales bacterium]